MRGCMLVPVLVLLLGANAYTIWQVHLMRGEIAGLRIELAEARAAAGHQGNESRQMSMLDYARDAADAIGRGEIARAKSDLDRISRMAAETKQMAEERRQEITARIREAEEAVSRGGAAAREKVGGLVRFLSRERHKDEPTPR